MRPAYSDGALVGPNLTLLALMETPPPTSGWPQRSRCSSPSTPPRVRPVTATETRPFPSGPDSANRPSSGAVNGGASDNAVGTTAVVDPVCAEARNAVGVPARLAQPARSGPSRNQTSAPSAKATVAVPMPTRSASPPRAAVATRQSAAATTEIVQADASNTSQEERAALPDPSQCTARQARRPSWLRSKLVTISARSRSNATVPSPSHNGRYEAMNGRNAS